MDAAKLAAWALILAGVGPTVTAIGQLYMIHLTRKQNAKLDDHGRQLAKVEEHTNGLTKALGDAKLQQGLAEGKAVGLEQGRDEVRE